MTRKRRLLTAALLIIIFIFVACVATAAYVYDATVQAVNPARRPLEVKQQNLQKRGFDVKKLQAAYSVKTVNIDSTFGDHKIPAHYLTVAGNRNRDTVVLAHGLNGNRLTGYPVAAMFLRNGYNVLTYDQRDSGENSADYMTCGFWESRDFRDCVAYVRSQTGKSIKVGGRGSSVGGATVGFYLGTEKANENLDFAILDSPVSDTRRIVESFLLRDKASFLPIKFRSAMGNIANQAILGFSYDDADVRQYIKKTKVPVLIFSSKSDTVTPHYMATDLYRAIPHNHKQLFTVDASRHTNLYWDYPDVYEKTMIEFIKRNML